MKSAPHQYIERSTSKVVTEKLFKDRTIQIIYSAIREKSPFIFNLLISDRASSFLGFINYDFSITGKIQNTRTVLRNLGINEDELLLNSDTLDTYKKIFERQIQYWNSRPMEEDQSSIVSPADSKVITSSFQNQHNLFIKEKFFTYDELIGKDKQEWINTFQDGDYAIFRLTPEKYHYNHAPVSGRVNDIYEINGQYHSCNPGAIVKTITPFSKNQRMVTIIDTDVDHGTCIGLVAMVEVVALMIGRIVQCYSPKKYNSPARIQKGLFIKKGQPKSLFRPGSSTTILIFQKNRITFSKDLLENQARKDVQSRFTSGFKEALVETELKVRETIGEAR